MKFSIQRDLGLQLLALYLLFVGPVVIAYLVFDRVASERIQADVKAADLALARAIAQETNTALDLALLAVENLSTYPEVINSDVNGMKALFATLISARPDINLVYRLDEKGIMLFHAPTGPGSTVGEDFSFRDYFQRALTAEQALLSLGRISPTTNQPVTTAVMPIRDNSGNFLGLVATNIKLQSLSTTLESITAEYGPQEGFEVQILDASGYVIAHPDHTLLLIDLKQSNPQIVSAVLSGQTGNLIEKIGDAPEKLYSYVPIPSAGWGVIVSRPTATAFATAQATHRGVLLSVTVFLIVGLFFWLALSRQVIRPMERLATFSQTIGLEIDPPDKARSAMNYLAERPDQIGHLIRSLTRMETAIQARLKELSTLLETSAAVVSTLDSQTVLNRILEQVERLTNIQMAAIVALDKKRNVFRAVASRGLSNRYAEQLAISPSEPHSVTLRAIRTGEPIQVSDTEIDASFTAFRPRARSEGYRSVLAVPLLMHHAPSSALLVYRPDPHVFTDREVDLITSFANHAAMAIENAALYARSDMRLQEQTRRLEALIESLQDGLVLEDLHGCILYANRRIAEMIKLTVMEIIGAPVQLLVDQLLSMAVSEDDENNIFTRQTVEDTFSGQGVGQVEIQVKTQLEIRYFRLQVFEVTDLEGMLIGRGHILRDITRNREIDRMKSSLISTVSHELRTPLAAIKGYATTLLADDVEWDRATQYEFLEIISKETDRLSKLVNDLLDMSRIESGNLDVNRSDCDLRELLSHAAQRAHPDPTARLMIDIPKNIPTLYVDAQRIEAVLRNLIENAAKYAEDTSPITVSAETSEDSIIIRVKDEGPGIPSEFNQSIFQSFYRLDQGLTRTATGAGLGLAICKGFVNAHGGNIWLEPRSNGTCIAFSLPLDHHDPDHKDTDRDIDDIIETALKDTRLSK